MTGRSAQALDVVTAGPSRPAQALDVATAGPARPIATEPGWWEETLGRCRFPDPAHGPVTMAVSGGADSSALVLLARRAGLVGTVVHVDHGLRPGSGAEAEWVEALAEDSGFAFRAVRVEVADGPDLEARARRARYAVLPPGVLTGHTMDDQAETVLLNLLRGAGMDGLAGMRVQPAGEGYSASEAGAGEAGAGEAGAGEAGAGEAGAGLAVVEAGPVRSVGRPLLGLRRSDTEEACRRAGITPLDDPSNLDPRFRRNRVRRELLPLLEDISARDVVPVLARQAGLIGEDVELLDRLAATIDPTDVIALRCAPAALARRALRAWLRAGEGHHPPSAAELARVMDVVAGRIRACELAGGRRVSRRAGRLYLGVPGTAPR